MQIFNKTKYMIFIIKITNKFIIKYISKANNKNN